MGKRKYDGISVSKRVVKSIYCVIVNDDQGRMLDMDLAPDQQAAASIEAGYCELYNIDA